MHWCNDETMMVVSAFGGISLMFQKIRHFFYHHLFHRKESYLQAAFRECDESCNTCTHEDCCSESPVTKEMLLETVRVYGQHVAVKDKNVDWRCKKCGSYSGDDGICAGHSRESKTIIRHEIIVTDTNTKFCNNCGILNPDPQEECEHPNGIPF